MWGMRLFFTVLPLPGRVLGRNGRRAFGISRSRRWTKRNESEIAARQKAHIAKMADQVDYKSWTHENLIERVTQLEKELKEKTISFATPTVQVKKSTKPEKADKPQRERQFDPSKYNTRLVAFKLSYLGKNYNGFEHHANNTTPLPTIEEELWKAFNKARLIFPKDVPSLNPGEVNWEGCEYSKCGRTDKGVSAFGQVIGIRVRSNRPLSKAAIQQSSEDMYDTAPREHGIEILAPPLSEDNDISESTSDHVPLADLDSDSLNFDPIADEIPYPTVLNRLLPPDIRILAWCPFPPADFSARFSCKERQYRYFFTQPAFAPTPTNLEDPKATSYSSMKDGWLDIAAMRDAAKRFEGVHDFRNFCKVDPSKQITNFERNIYFADIEEVSDTTGALAFFNTPPFNPAVLDDKTTPPPKVYTFTLHGSAFLWHQVRHMVAILFLVGQGLESPSLVTSLLDTTTHPSRPMYEMASDTPLVLWNCVFPSSNDLTRKDALQWHHVGSGVNQGDNKYGTPGLIEELWKVWRERKIDEVLAANLMKVVSEQGDDVEKLTSGGWRKSGKSQKVFDGGDRPNLRGSYVRVLEKPRMEAVEVINERYAKRKGFERKKDVMEQGFRSVNGNAGANGVESEKVE